MNKIILKVGDWSNDGHNITDSYTIECNMTTKKLSRIIRGQKLIDINSECSEYEDSSLSVECTNKLIELGIIDSSMDRDYQDENRVLIYPDVWVEILLKVVKHLVPEFEYRIISNEEINIGGYGLYK